MRTGKIARLPYRIRTQLNYRLMDGQMAKEILPWLNDLPEVKEVIHDHFHDHPITEQNLSEWSTDAYREWLLHEEVLTQASDLVSRGSDLDVVTLGRLSQALQLVISARYAVVLNTWDGNDISEAFLQKLKTLRQLSLSITQLRRTDQQDIRLGLQREEIHDARGLTKTELVQSFQRWQRIPEIRDLLQKTFTTPDNRDLAFRHAFNLAEFPNSLHNPRVPPIGDNTIKPTIAPSAVRQPDLATKEWMANPTGRRRLTQEEKDHEHAQIFGTDPEIGRPGIQPSNNPPMNAEAVPSSLPPALAAAFLKVKSANQAKSDQTTTATNASESPQPPAAENPSFIVQPSTFDSLASDQTKSDQTVTASHSPSPISPMGPTPPIQESNHPSIPAAENAPDQTKSDPHPPQTSRSWIPWTQSSQPGN